VDGCGVAPEDGYALCLGTPSDRPVDVGGWLHRVAPAEGAQREGAGVPRGGAGAAEALVLVVEDDAVVGEMIRLVLEDEGYAVDWCRSAGEALRTTRARRPQAVVLDLRLPDGRGEGLMRRLRADPATFDVPVVVLSAAADGLGSDEMQLARAVLEKPFDVEELLVALTREVPG
jgi:CheY-like chemotaxis protein